MHWFGHRKKKFGSFTPVIYGLELLDGIQAAPSLAQTPCSPTTFFKVHPAAPPLTFGRSCLGRCAYFPSSPCNPKFQKPPRTTAEKKSRALLSDLAFLVADRARPKVSATGTVGSSQRSAPKRNLEHRAQLGGQMNCNTAVNHQLLSQ